MDKKYQIFVSSTYSDLKSERQAAINAIMKLRQIPAGEVVLGRESMHYQKVLDDFPNVKQVRILTYNISKN